MNTPSLSLPDALVGALSAAALASDGAPDDAFCSLLTGTIGALLVLIRDPRGAF